MSEHPIEGMISTTLKKIKQMVDINSIIGDPITAPDGTIIIPTSRISYGLGSGGSDFPMETAADRNVFDGGAAAGVTIQPVTSLAISGGNVRMMQVDPYHGSVDRMIGIVPEVFNEVNDMITQKKVKKSASSSGFGKLDDPQI